MEKKWYKGNNHTVVILYWNDLTEKEKKEFDYEGAAESQFFRAYGRVYDFSSIIRCDKEFAKEEFDGYLAETAFSGILVRFTNDGDGVLVYRYSL